jgi:hypothetical protein
MVGLRNGEFICLSRGEGGDAEALFIPIYICEDGVLFSMEEAMAGEDRRKRYDTVGQVPFVTTGTFWRSDVPAHYYSQIEVVVGLGPSVRLGFNPGEFLDFLLGWFGVSIYGDDREAEREREGAEKKAEERSAGRRQPAPRKEAGPWVSCASSGSR